MRVADVFDSATSEEEASHDQEAFGFDHPQVHPAVLVEIEIPAGALTVKPT
jgi:hypothetical protein